MDITKKAVVEPPKNAAPPMKAQPQPEYKIQPAAAKPAAAVRPPTSLAQSATVTTRDIARRAYDLYVTRGREDRHDVEDWMQAERELRTGSAAA
jgi:hypothetical protein